MNMITRYACTRNKLVLHGARRFGLFNGSLLFAESQKRISANWMMLGKDDIGQSRWLNRERSLWLVRDAHSEYNPYNFSVSWTLNLEKSVGKFDAIHYQLAENARDR